MPEYEAVWFCHECSAGPYLVALATQCVEDNCTGHHKCDNCETQWVVKERSTNTRSPATLAPHVFYPTDSKTFTTAQRTLVNAGSTVTIFPQIHSIHAHRRSNSTPTLYRQKENKGHVVNHDHTVVSCCACKENIALGGAHNLYCDFCGHLYCSSCDVETVKDVS
jgi:hypothetical protein